MASPLRTVQTELPSAMRRGFVAAYRCLGTRDASLDAVQEAAARALAAQQRYDPRQPFYTLVLHHPRQPLPRPDRSPHDARPGAAVAAR